jgi:Fungal specific transcription factor domain
MVAVELFPELNLDNPKQIFNCDFPECRRSFVRQDLCTRHKERHTARGSQLQRKDAFMQNMNPFPTTRPLDPTKDVDKFITSPDSRLLPVDPVSGADIKSHMGQSGSSGNAALGTFSPISDKSSTTMAGSNGSNASTTADVQPQAQSQRSDSGGENLRLGRSNSSHGESNSQNFDLSQLPQSPGNVRPSYGGNRHSSFSSIDALRHPMHSQGDTGVFVRPTLQTSIASNAGSLPLSSPYSASSPSIPQSFVGRGQLNSGPLVGPHHHGSAQGHHNSFINNMVPFSLPPPGYPTMSQTTSSGASETAFSTSLPKTSPSVARGAIGVPTASSTGGPDPTMIGTMNAPYPISVFGGEGYSRSPFAMADDFAAWLFSEQQNAATHSPTRQSLSGAGGFMGDNMSCHPGYYVGSDQTLGGYYPQTMPPQHPMSVTSILDTSVPETLLSEEKRQSLLELIETRFNEANHAPIARLKQTLFDDRIQSDEDHVLSLRMMQTYIGSFWYHVHPQLPILHKPTFVADKTKNLLLIAIMAIGASCLDKTHSPDITQAAAELSNFLAWHLRWEIFSDSDFQPPAKLWIFQALLLLEIYEKMYSTRAFHERAHIHHATTITLMRRGSSLIGREADSPGDEKQINGSNHSTSSTTPDEWWNRWITNEATRRVAFAAFVTDSTHATMFGHSAVMVAHEMRLPLPCDEALWSATSSAEVGRVESILHASGVKTTTFLDGLKKTLNGQNVRTNSFGRTILMAGLLSVSWHMNQRDLQVSWLGVKTVLGGRDKWRGALTRAFDFWKADFDKSLAQLSDDSDAGQYNYFNSLQDTNIFENRNVLHHLAHMAMHVDIVDCQIFAGAARLLGRTIGPQDYAGAQRRMKEWAPTARARDATFYAVRFLSQVLLPGNHNISGGACTELYAARDDFLLNRPWVLYFAALIIWSYGYALDGPVSALDPPLLTNAQKRNDMCVFLQRIGGVQSPEELSSLSGRNACVGLLLVLRDMFKQTRWELLHEAASLLTVCAETLTGAG